ncbi:MAG: hypothetical protein B7Z12_17785 [Caulobacter vibrioides]|uniref:Uncharacterized protein n=1 Tax=Caulobacter vibrioides TaxID=155892 RepID=A0A258CX18_CAUVI|nr:MAG: hypothetical protein B7Z12_17785 [Caulobacter vibrioides]
MTKPPSEAFLALSPTGFAILPTAPTHARLPRPGGDDDVATHTVLVEVAALHLAAFVTLHGPPPQALAYEAVRYGRPGELRPGYLITLQGRPCAGTAAWLAASASGLQADAGWSNPIVQEPGPLGFHHWWTATLQEAAEEAAGRLKRTGHIHHLRNLSAHVPGLPARLDPDSPVFNLLSPRTARLRG